jgi:hypothetical protein
VNSKNIMKSLLLRLAEPSDTPLAFLPSPVGRGWRGAPGEGNTKDKTEASSVTLL